MLVENDKIINQDIKIVEKLFYSIIMLVENDKIIKQDIKIVKKLF